MRKYLGGYMAVYSACALPVLILLSLAVAVVPVLSKISFATIVLSSFGAVGTICMVIWFKQTALELYSWGEFSDNGVVVKSLFTTYKIEYEKCQSVGIGYYTHRVLNSKLGSKVRFIYLSYDGFEEKYKTKMNLFKNSKQQIKIGYNEKVYERLINTLPKNHAKSLKEDYEKYIV